jgi:rhomboid protease GluP
MRLPARLLRSALEIVIRLLDGLGARGIRWEWKKNAWRQGLENRIAAWENLERGVRAPHRMCPACRTLVERQLRVCPACGASLRGVPGGGLPRILRLLAPGAGSVTLLLVTVNVAMSMLILASWGSGQGGGLMGLMAPPSTALYLFGAKWTPAIVAGQVWRLVTASYLHGGLLHLGFNCYALMVLGPLIEGSFGARKFFLIYSATGVAAFVTSALAHPGSLSVGASGALFGLMGFAIVFGRYRSGPSGRAIASQLTRNLLFMAVLFLIPGIDNSAHVGGLLAGALLGLIVDAGEPRTRGAALALNLSTAAAVLLTLASFLAMGLSYRGNLRAISPASSSTRPPVDRRAVALLGCLAMLQGPSSGVASVDPAEAERLVSTGGALVLDVREPEEFVGSGHIPGAHLLPLDLLPSAPATLPRDGRPILVVCEHGIRSVHAARFLARAGCEAVVNLAGGMAAWRGRRAREPGDPSTLGPSSWLVGNAGLLPRGGQALDLACGRGRHALLLAAAGFSVRAVDRDAAAIASLRDAGARLGLPVQAETLDLEGDGVDLGEGSSDFVLGTHYLHRPLFPAIVRAVRPGGILIYETYTVDQAARGRPTNPAFLLRHGELERLVAPLEILAARDGEYDGGSVAGIVARRPTVGA